MNGLTLRLHKEGIHLFWQKNVTKNNDKKVKWNFPRNVIDFFYKNMKAKCTRFQMLSIRGALVSAQYANKVEL